MDFYSLDTHKLQRLNSLTKYPSIPTFHQTDGNGKLTPKQTYELDNPEEYHITEKLDGTNSRIVFDHHGNYLIGIREHFIWASKDLIINDTMGIIPQIREVAEKILNHMVVSLDDVFCVYGESYGGNINGAKNYSKSGVRGFRVFDAAYCPLPMLDHSLEHISNWRENGGQEFLDVEKLTGLLNYFDIDQVPTLGVRHIGDLSLEAAYELVKGAIPETLAGLSDDRNNKAEGIVIRTKDRKIITKLRYQDYERVLGNKI